MPSKRYLFYISKNYSFAILRPIQAAIVERGGEVAWFVMGRDISLEYFNKNEKRLQCVDEIKKFDPLAVLYPANIAPTFLPGINVAIFHGFDAGKLDKKGNNDHYKVRNCFDLYCTQGPESTAAFLELEKNHQSFKVKETGWSALDPLFQLNNMVNNKGKKTILLCSTFSKKLSCAPHLFEKVKQLSQTGKWRWLVQFHPKMSLEVVEKYKSIQNEHLEFIETDDVIPLLQQADVMVCDTSSVLIMFLLLHKPVVTFNNISPDDYLIDINDPEVLESSIENALLRPSRLMDKIQTFIDHTHPYNDANSSYRVLDAIDEVLEESKPVKAKSIDILRQFKMRKKLNYWKFW
ncbi:CDP-glycerol glycerophosphotransferase family protein [Pseudoalteromonas denitrificans]|uniref:CDP-glycerol glycerophosphotransferase, TagB/SpsB family n=1 Tax=Pseudoalteromonas denitrificans DSM 6059 TaxID=1123010 RepID=A0A1I1L4N8_9GAMM|nr:CDP-glycerol glycerophosphotransferase family protein [Pseudoalteromonas denitrificans]SFC64560.1 CDP-glycerol glycerophosphotransferase, TagB/SpsB family [Pseudoalteromonas denitrificans DSM 6059]